MGRLYQMQTISNLQRDSNDNKTALFGWLVFLIVYESLSAIYIYLPPLFGLMMSFLYVKKDEKAYFLVLIFLLFFESNHSFFVFSGWLFLWIFIKFIMPLVEGILDCKICLQIAAVVLSYLGFYSFIIIFNFLIGIQSEVYNYGYILYYIIIESLLILFQGKS